MYILRKILISSRRWDGALLFDKFLELLEALRFVLKGSVISALLLESTLRTKDRYLLSYPLFHKTLALSKSLKWKPDWRLIRNSSFFTAKVVQAQFSIGAAVSNKYSQDSRLVSLTDASKRKHTKAMVSSVKLIQETLSNLQPWRINYTLVKINLSKQCKFF